MAPEIALGECPKRRSWLENLSAPEVHFLTNGGGLWAHRAMSILARSLVIVRLLNERESCSRSTMPSFLILTLRES